MADDSPRGRALDSPLVNAAVSGVLTLYPLGRAPRPLRRVIVALPAALGAGLGLLIGYALATGRLHRSDFRAPDGTDATADDAPRPAEPADAPDTPHTAPDGMADGVAAPRDLSPRTIVVTAVITTATSAALAASAWLSLASDRWIENRLAAVGARRPRLVMAASAAAIGYVDARSRNQRNQRPPSATT